MLLFTSVYLCASAEEASKSEDRLVLFGKAREAGASYLIYSPCLPTLLNDMVESVHIGTVFIEISIRFKVVANKDFGRQRKWILTHQHCTTCLPPDTLAHRLLRCTYPDCNFVRRGSLWIDRNPTFFKFNQSH